METSAEQFLQIIEKLRKPFPEILSKIERASKAIKNDKFLKILLTIIPVKSSNLSFCLKGILTILMNTKHRDSFLLQYLPFYSTVPAS